MLVQKIFVFTVIYAYSFLTVPCTDTAKQEICNIIKKNLPFPVSKIKNKRIFRKSASAGKLQSKNLNPKI